MLSSTGLPIALGTLLLVGVVRALDQQYDGDDCSSCSLMYDPVVDVGTALPFYNECMARCQLGPSSKLIPASDRNKEPRAARTAAAGLSNRENDAEVAKPNYLKLVPKPASGATTAAARVDRRVMMRYAREGFTYVGRPGFIQRDASSAPKPDRSTLEDIAAGTPEQAAAKPDTSGAASTKGDGTIALLRIVAPEGDMYMKAMSRDEEKRLIKQYTDPSSPAWSWSRPSVPIAGGSSGGGGGARHRRLLVQLGNDRTDGDTSGVKTGTHSTGSKTGDAGFISARHHHARSLSGEAVVIGEDDRWEVEQLAYPYTAVSLLTTDYYTEASAKTSFQCTAAMVGSTGRIALTAGHCLYGYDTPGFYGDYRVSPGVYSGNSNPYGEHWWDSATIRMEWMNEGRWSTDIGLLSLQYHLPFVGTLGIAYECSPRNYSLVTAGYPDDKPPYSMWAQVSSVVTDVCKGPADKYFSFDASFRQSGSPFWTSVDSNLRFILINTGAEAGNGALAIKPGFYAMISQLVRFDIIETAPYYLVGGPNSNMMVKCDKRTLRCVITKSKEAATPFRAYPIASTNRFALVANGTKLCLSLSGGDRNGSVTLRSCNAENDFKFAPNELWSFYTDHVYGNITAARSDTGGYLQWTGVDQPLLAAPSCTKRAKCTWQKLDSWELP